jgi:hypothetical protein
MTLHRHVPLVDWSYSGQPDLSAGAGATKTERRLPFLGATLLGSCLVIDVLQGGAEWTALQWLVGLAMAFDIGGGVVANGLNSCKRFYHSSAISEDGTLGRLAKKHWLFAALHVHLPVASLVWLPDAMVLALLSYLLLQASAAIVRLTPLYLARPVAFLITGAVIVAEPVLGPPIDHLEWLLPLLFLKIVLGHSVREEPYRPATDYPTGKGQSVQHGQRKQHG